MRSLGKSTNEALGRGGETVGGGDAHGRGGMALAVADILDRQVKVVVTAPVIHGTGAVETAFEGIQVVVTFTDRCVT